jgi:hypothetical protein
MILIAPSNADEAHRRFVTGKKKFELQIDA